jgi:chromosome segregation ATPase
LLDFERTRLDGLEDRVKQLSQERLDKLNGLKDRLAESLNVLEDLERAHCKKVEQFKSRLDAEDRAYQGKLAKLAEEQKKTIAAMAREHAQLVQRAKSQEKAVQQLETQSESERDRADEEIAKLRKDIDTALAESKCDDAEKQTNATLSSTMQTLQRTEQILAEKENDVVKLRMENESLKREVARIRHEGLIAARKIGKVT